MLTHGTASQLHVDGGYVEFQQAVLRALPHDIDPNIADGWRNNTGALAKVLREALLPPDNPATEAAPVPKPEPQPLLIPVCTEKVFPRVAFTARDRFVVNTKKNAPVKISYLGDNFKAWFLGKEEQPFAGSTLNCSKLSRYSVDGPIIKELGGEEKAETTLAELFSLMEMQKNGESGALLTNGYANIFYIKDTAGGLRTVDARWGGVGWLVHAFAVAHPYEWSDGCRVFSRDSR